MATHTSFHSMHKLQHENTKRINHNKLNETGLMQLDFQIVKEALDTPPNLLLEKRPSGYILLTGFPTDCLATSIGKHTAVFHCC